MCWSLRRLFQNYNSSNFPRQDDYYEDERDWRERGVVYCG